MLNRVVVGVTAMVWMLGLSGCGGNDTKTTVQTT